MKENTKLRLLKYVRIILPITLVMYLYELTIGDYISFGSLTIDYLFYYTTKSLFLFNLSMIVLYLYLKQKKKSLKIFSLIIFFPLGALFLLYFPFNIGAIINSPYNKYYFFEENDIKYYMISERFFALDDMELKIYKEKPVFFFIKHRSSAEEDLLVEKGINIQKVRDKYIQRYF